MRAIDADAVIRAVDKHTMDGDGFAYLDDDITCILEEVPAVELGTKTGRWVKMVKHHKDEQQEFDYYEIRCSECGEKPEKSYHLTPYCPWCGAKMEGVEE